MKNYSLYIYIAVTPFIWFILVRNSKIDAIINDSRSLRDVTVSNDNSYIPDETTTIFDPISTLHLVSWQL